MVPRPAIAAALLALAATACTWGGAPALVVAGVEPRRAPNDLDLALRIAGSGFEPSATADFDHPSRSDVDARFAVTLVSGVLRVPLDAVARVSSGELSATLPAGAPPGAYDVEVRGPGGAVATRPLGFVLYVNDLPPRARLAVSPGGGTAGTTVFTLDASGSADARYPLSSLEFRFDPRGDGSWTPWGAAATLTTTHALPGDFTAAVEVREARGLTAFATALVVVAAAGTEVQVTTAADERDDDASPANPKGTGLSLREAVAWVNAHGTASTITLAAPMTITMTPPSTYMTLTAPGAAIVAEPGVVLDFGGINQNCMTLAGPGERLVGVTLTGCTGTFVAMGAGSGGSQVAQATFVVTGTPYWAYGIAADATSTAWSRIGPGNDLSKLYIGVNVKGDNYEIVGNRLDDNGTGALLKGGAARVWGNTFSRQTASGSNKGLGVSLQASDGQVEILQNTFDRNAGDAVAGAALAGLTVRDNLFTSGLGFGLSASGAPLLHDHNGYFGNASGPVAAPLVTGADDLLADPLYVDAAGGDCRLLPASPAIDAGLDTGLDVNGPAVERFSGAAPDLGAWESP